MVKLCYDINRERGITPRALEKVNTKVSTMQFRFRLDVRLTVSAKVMALIAFILKELYT